MAVAARVSPMVAPTEGPVAAVEVLPRLVLRQPERPEPQVVAQSVPGLLRETHREVGEPRAAIEPLLVITPNMAAPEEGEAVRDHLPVSTVGLPYMAAGPELAAGVLLVREESVASGGLILPAAAGLPERKMGTPEGLAAVTHSVAATAEAEEAVGPRIRTVAPVVPVVPRAEREAVELRVGLVPGRVV